MVITTVLIQRTNYTILSLILLASGTAHAFQPTLPAFVNSLSRQQQQCCNLIASEKAIPFKRSSGLKIKILEEEQDDEEAYDILEEVDDIPIEDVAAAIPGVGPRINPRDVVYMEEDLADFLLKEGADDSSLVYDQPKVQKVFYTPPVKKAWAENEDVFQVARDDQKHEAIDKVLDFQKEFLYFTEKMFRILQKLKKLEETNSYFQGILADYLKLSKDIEGLDKNITSFMAQYNDLLLINTANKTLTTSAVEEKMRFLLNTYSTKINNTIHVISMPMKYWSSKRPLDGFFDVDAVLESMDEDAAADIFRLDLNMSSWIYNEQDFHDNRRLIIFDYQFNLKNLWLASVKLYPDDTYAIPTHWIKALCEQKKYEEFREEQKDKAGYDWTSSPMSTKISWWSQEELESTNVAELKEYWKLYGGYDTVPQRGIEMEEIENADEDENNELTFEEENILAWQKWMEEVYDEEDDNMLEDEMSEEEAFIDDKKVDPWVRDVAAFDKEFKQESEDFKRAIYTKEEYEVLPEEDDDVVNSTAKFRGHLVIACSSSEQDMELSVKITERMDKEFGTQVFVETRVYGHAKPDDNVYEIWLESWNVDLLHSKRRATFDRDWTGPKVVDDATLDALVEQIRFLISDDARFSFDFNEFVDLVQAE